jgi:hypothetical protein
MNTPAHAMISLALLGTPKQYRNSPRFTTSLIIGSILPDVVIIIFYAWHLMIGTPEPIIWSIGYYDPAWQAAIDIFNSMPLLLILLLIGWHFKHPLIIVLAASMLLHTFADLPLHHDDGHRHFFPFSDWRFVSPVSYWDPAHHGKISGLVELLSVWVTGFFIIFKFPPLRIWAIGILLTYGLYTGYVVMVWVYPLFKQDVLTSFRQINSFAL